MPITHRRLLAATAAAVVLSATLAACGAGKKSTGDGGGSGSAGGGTGGAITVGTTDKIVALDPAGSYDLGSQQIETQIYQYVMTIPAGGTKPQPDAAQSCQFTKPTEYTCTIRPNQKFSNGDPLTAKDVAFSFQRVIKINDPNGPASLLANMASVAAPDDTTVVFTLKASDANDQTWPFILGTDAGPIVDSKVFPADQVLPDDKVVGSGPYKITSYNKNQMIQFQPNTNYGGANKPKTSNIALKYYTTADNLKLDIQTGAIDVAWRSLTPVDIDSLRKTKNVKVLSGPGGALQYIVFNFKTMPGDSDAQKLAIRRAVAYSVDRASLASKVFKDTYQPAYSMLPDGLPGHVDAFKDEFGASPDKSKAVAELQQAGVKTPVSLKIEYTSDHYGPTSDQLYNEVKRQLEGTGLFSVSLQSTEWDSYQKQRVQDAYPVYQLGWFPDFPDADNYLSPFLVENNFVHAHYCDPGAANRPCDQDKMSMPLSTEETKTEAARVPAFQQIQKTLATGTVPYVPLLEGQQIAVTRSNISGVQNTLDISFLFRFWLFSKG
jgi:peptide/nickel transport system substrate-binding protein